MEADNVQICCTKEIVTGYKKRFERKFYFVNFF